jgi:2-amino-4-hydroxy-6-hydroxymethyldihydropteridine diphosphokinase
MREAARRIELAAPILARSRVYETDPVGGPEQPRFLNAAVAVSYSGEPLALLDALQAIEKELGRTRDVRWGPRTIDLDVLWTDGPPIELPRLVVPHPRLAERAFALLPLADVAPEARYVVRDRAGVTVTDLSLTGP